MKDLKFILEEEIANYFNDDWYFQEKIDSKKFMLSKKEDSIRSYDSKGSFFPIPIEIYKFLQNYKKDFFIECDLSENKLYVLDILEFENKNLKDFTFEKRYKILEELIKNIDFEFFIFSKAFNKNKKNVLEEFKNNKSDVIYIKNKVSKYYDYYWTKFYTFHDCTVKKVDAEKRSVSLLKNKKNIGNIIIPKNHNLPKEKQIIKIRCLEKSGKLINKKYLKVN